MTKNAPGVLLYFDLRPALDLLTYEEKGEIFDAILAYGEDGTVPDFDSDVLNMLWAFVVRRIDADRANYLAKCEKNRQRALKRWNADACEGLPEDAEPANNNSNVNSNVNPNVNSNSTSSSASASAATAPPWSGAVENPVEKSENDDNPVENC